MYHCTFRWHLLVLCAVSLCWSSSSNGRVIFCTKAHCGVNLWGHIYWLRTRADIRWDWTSSVVGAGSCALAGIGSAYHHWQPQCLFHVFVDNPNPVKSGESCSFPCSVFDCTTGVPVEDWARSRHFNATAFQSAIINLSVLIPRFQECIPSDK